mmetsp:Transcript_24394/g.55527  ORF Transcript_24394/g.55527 Transcript_24394/m.55527 type:complete len:219 (+) Transcript_24394:492-1148(+)
MSWRRPYPPRRRPTRPSRRHRPGGASCCSRRTSRPSRSPSARRRRCCSRRMEANGGRPSCSSTRSQSRQSLPRRLLLQPRARRSYSRRLAWRRWRRQPWRRRPRPCQPSQTPPCTPALPPPPLLSSFVRSCQRVLRKRSGGNWPRVAAWTPRSTASWRRKRGSIRPRGSPPRPKGRPRRCLAVARSMRSPRRARWGCCPTLPRLRQGRCASPPASVAR